MHPSRGWSRMRYSLYAPLYDRVLESLPFFRAGRRRAVELAGLRRGERVLIVAAGTGLDLELIPEGVDVVATDLSPAMVARVRQRAARLHRPVRAEVMDAGALDYPDNSFDCVLLHLALAVVPDPMRAAREAARVLRPGGRATVFDKFLADDARPSLLRRVVNVPSSLLFTSLTRRLGPLLDAAGLELRAKEPAGLGGLFVVARAEKPGAARSM
jgi:phosphatidylethanolamine/phosphatidyl-N-methylethanolamine N-methyltransferase